jgi:hypothetical protein
LRFIVNLECIKTRLEHPLNTQLAIASALLGVPVRATMALEGVVVGVPTIPILDGARGACFRDVRASAAPVRSAPAASTSVEKIPLLGSGRGDPVRCRGRFTGYSIAVTTALVLLATLAVTAVVGVSIKTSRVAAVDSGDAMLPSLGAAGAKVGERRAGFAGSATDVPDRPTALQAFNPFTDARGLKLDPRHLPELTPAGLARSQKATMMVDQVNTQWLESAAAAAREDTDEFDAQSTSRDARNARQGAVYTPPRRDFSGGDAARANRQSVGGEARVDAADDRYDSAYDPYDDSSAYDSGYDDSYAPARVEHARAARQTQRRVPYDDERDDVRYENRKYDRARRDLSGGGVILGGARDGERRRKRPVHRQTRNYLYDDTRTARNAYADDFDTYRDFDVPVTKREQQRRASGGLGAFRDGNVLNVADETDTAVSREGNKRFSFDPDPEQTAARLRAARSQKNKRGQYKGLPATRVSSMGLQRRPCVLKRDVTEQQAQAVLDYACNPANDQLSQKMSCAPITKGGRAFHPNTKRDHAAWAITSFFFKRSLEADAFAQRDCHFNGVATLNGVGGNFYLADGNALTTSTHSLDALLRKATVTNRGLVFTTYEPVAGTLTDTVSNNWAEQLILPESGLEDDEGDVSVDSENQVIRKRRGPATTFKFWVGAKPGLGGGCFAGTALRVSQIPASLFYLSAGDCCPYIAIYKTDTFFYLSQTWS